MCGITGVWTSNRNQDRILSEVTTAVATLRHRGPDDKGIWINKLGLGLGHTRLSILDLSDRGHQPMISKDGRFAIVFNGEVYNFRAIRKTLEAKGYSFSGSGDTEVILQALIEWGADAVQQFIGMFAIAFWDEQEQVLQLFRDRLGVKPLYYGWTKNTLCFGSELKSLRAYTHWTPKLCLEAVGEFLQYGYIAESRSVYEGVHKLQPGHRLVLKKNQSPYTESYWSILNHLNDPHPINDQEIESELESLLIDSFRYRMVSDVPVGVYLSGGVDSSLVTAVLAKHCEQDIRTFTIGFKEDKYDESKWAAKVASHCNTRHTEYVLKVSEALNIAKEWGDLFDEPFGDSSGIPTLLISRLASRDVKVVLSADGGDELFSGYDVYASVLRRLKQFERIPRHFAAALSWLLSVALAGSPGRQQDRLIPAVSHGTFIRRLQRMSKMLQNPTAGRFMDIYLSYWQPEQVNRLIGRYVPPRYSADSYPGSPATQISLWDMHHYLPEDILTKVDRTTMAVSIEGREPLLDHRIAEYAISLPPHMRRGLLGSKHVIKKILYRYIPRELVDRPKQGFGIPLTDWLRTDMKELVHDYLAEQRIRGAGIMDPLMVSTVVKNFYSGNETLSTPLWFLLAFEMWREKWG